MKKLSERLVDIVKQAAGERGQGQVADDLGIDRGRMSRIVHGERWLSLREIDRIVNHFGIFVGDPTRNWNG